MQPFLLAIRVILLAGLLPTSALAMPPVPGLDGLALRLVEETGSPGAALAVLDQGEFAEGVAGVRSVDAEAAIAPGDLWHLGSNTKAMTATLAARLVEQGVIGWDSQLDAVLREAGFEIRPDYEAVTLTELLQHRSGMVANLGLLTTLSLAGGDSQRDAVRDRRRYAAAVLGEAPAVERGDFLYSNAGYVVAGLMLETAAGVPYEALMQREVFDPLGMRTAGWGPPGVAGEQDQPRGHRAGLFGGLSAREPGATADNIVAMNSAGRAHMSLADLARFLQAHLDGANGQSGYLTESSWTQLHTPPGGGNYALGWGVSPQQGRLSHAGSNTMWFMQMAIEPASGRGAIVVVNDGRISQVSEPTSRLIGQLLSP